LSPARTNVVDVVTARFPWLLFETPYTYAPPPD
jgi:hypothetical protein